MFLSQQHDDGTWPQSRPLFHYPRVGSAYCFDFEALAQMFLCVRLHEPLFAHIDRITKATVGLDAKRFKLSNGGYAWASRSDSAECGTRTFRSTASVFLIYLFALDRFLAEAIRRSIANELEVPYPRHPKFWNEEVRPTLLRLPNARNQELSEIGKSEKQTLSPCWLGLCSTTKHVWPRDRELPEARPRVRYLVRAAGHIEDRDCRSDRKLYWMAGYVG